ncbi:Calcium/calmodulin-dependent protein kinase type 1, partial [Entomortierella chlamydospora]
LLSSCLKLNSPTLLHPQPANILDNTVAPLSSAPAPLTISIPLSAKTSNAVDPVSDIINSIPENTIQQVDSTTREREAESIDHYTYHTSSSRITVQPFILEPESPSSPILSAWPPAQLNPDYLAPYHPALHKSVNNWSQIVLDQIQQKRNSKPSEGTSSEHQGALTIQSAVSSSLSGVVVASPSTFKGVSIVPQANLSSETGESPMKVEKHYLFQTHHREPRPLAHQPSRECVQSQSFRQQHSRRRIRKAVARPFKRVARFIKRIVISIKGDESKGKKKAGRPSSIVAAPVPVDKDIAAKASEHSVPHLSISQDSEKEVQVDNDCGQGIQGQVQQQQQQQQQHQQQDGSVRGVPKMMKVIDQIMNDAGHNREVCTQSSKQSINDIQSYGTVSTTATEPEPQAPNGDRSANQRGPRMHPKLLELYEVTDHVLGEGTFATVKEVKLKSTGQSFALKIILKKLLVGKGSMINSEIAILSKVRHPNCVSLLEMFETEDAVYLVTDLAAGGELFDQLLKKGYYTEGDAARLVREILLGVEYLHSMDIVHRDLKPENLLFLDKSENSRLLITDFGLSKILTNGNDVLMTACGTPGYVAPEILEQVGHGKPVDMWSVGIIAYTLLCGYTPFWGENQPALFQNIIAGTYKYEDEYWKDISPLAKNFIDTLLVRDAMNRSTATQALSHPWFRAVLDQNLSAPASPSESINLLPGVRKNFNAGQMFKKAIRAVGILRRIQAAQYPQNQIAPSGPPPPRPPRPADDLNLGSLANIETPNMIEIKKLSSIAARKNRGLKFQDVVGAAVLANQGARLDITSNENAQVAEATDNKDDDVKQIEKADSAFEMAIK